MDVYMRAVGEGPRTINFVHYNHHEGSRLTAEEWRLARGLLGNTKRWSFPEDYSEREQGQIEKRGFERGLLFTGGLGCRNGYEL
ncbi:MAG TPA: hypothetical protein VEZ71_07300, partial [Archangium sp.]|nr:hypothetical protein [Archangium sp.]